ncbi:MAG TPA: HemK/PrmC family methyltransferase, partial [Alphaproteobacteria bacterium]|nr:HemK/PrmC family methyltransferase [Alphaproteobacteria bacterium]
IDQSADAIATAEKNAIENNLAARAKFLQLDWHDTDRLCALGTFDIILCNPPYIPTHNIEDLQSEVRQHDPMRALDGGPDGLAPYRIIAPHLAHLLKRTAIALFEFGHDQATDIQDIMSSHHYQTSPAYQDLGGNDRVIIVSNKNS